MSVPISLTMHWRQAWATGAVYHLGDMVTSAGSVYICKKPLVSTTAPGSDSTHWDLLCSIT